MNHGNIGTNEIMLINEIRKHGADLVEIEVSNSQEVGRALAITVYDDEWDRNKIVYIPISTIHEIHPESVVMDRWIAQQKGLI